MGRITTCDLRDKEVVNICDGVRLGYPSDFEFDTQDGRISALIVPRSGGFFSLFQGDAIMIPWHRIECIGSDAILVRLDRAEYIDQNRDKKKKGF